jgi:5-methyltetrahydropteroyltriglutamate--homocysteine methyltransferase
MQLSTDHILTTHAGSLPRPDDVAQMLYAIIDGKPVDQAALDERVHAAVAEVVARQRKVGIDVISDGELGKVGFSNYVIQRMSGFEGKADFMAADFADAPGVAMEAFGSEGGQHLRLPILNGPIEMRDTKAVDKEINDFKSALGVTSPDNAFVPAVTPGHVAFNFPNHYYKSHQQYIEAAATALAPEYKAIVNAGFNLQLDSPDAAMAFHCTVQGSDLADPAAHLAAGIEVLNDVLSGVPAEKIRYHVCWGNYRGPHHKDVALKDIVKLILKSRAKFIYVEAANCVPPAACSEGSILYICPLKALLNKLEPRLARYTSFVGRRAALWHGDIGEAARRRLLNDPPDVLLTTPLEAILVSATASYGTNPARRWHRVFRPRHLARTDVRCVSARRPRNRGSLHAIHWNTEL